METTNLSLCDYGDEDYIDMVLCSSPSTILHCPSPQTREFEFQMSTTCTDKAITTCPADELFYNGKLLPLHLLHPAPTTSAAFEEDHYCSTPFLSCSTAPCTNTPLDSCNISPSESCRVSCELNVDDYFFEWSNELNTSINNHPTKITWSKKLKLIRNSILGMNLKASKAYLKSLFTKSACSNESCTKANRNPQKESEASSDNYLKISNKKPFRHIDLPSCPTMEGNAPRRSFSGAIKRHSPTKCLSSSSSNSSSSSSSSSFSLNSNGFHELHFLRRSSSATEIEGSIEAAIAHCKKSQQIFDSRNPSGI